MVVRSPLSTHYDFLALGNRLDEYIHDYFVKRQLHASASTFRTEGNVSTEPVGKIIIREFSGERKFVDANALLFIGI